MKKTELKELYQMMFPNYPDVVTVKQLQVMLGVSRHLAYYLPTRNFMRIFSDSVLITALSAKRFLCRIPTGKNTVRRAAERFTESRKTRAQESTERTVRGAETPCLQGLF